jgi:hypothetical protein
LGSFNFLQETLEPTKRRSVATNPEELYPAQAAKIALLLTIPYVFQNRGEGGNTYSDMRERTRHEMRYRTNTSTNQNGDLHIENIFSRSTIGTINSHDWEGTGSASRIKLNELSARSHERSIFLIPFSTFHCGLRESGHNSRPSTDTLAKGLGPITDLTDVD